MIGGGRSYVSERPAEKPRNRRRGQRSERQRKDKLLRALLRTGWCQCIATENGHTTRLKRQRIQRSHDVAEPDALADHLDECLPQYGKQRRCL